MNRVLLISLVMQVLALACGQSPSAGEASPTPNDVNASRDAEVQLIAADWRGGTEAWVTVCFDHPTSSAWLLGRLSGDVALSDRADSVAMSSFELVGWRVGKNGEFDQRCDRIQFVMPSIQPQQEYTLTIQRIAADLPEDPDWEELQRRLDAVGTGIQIEPLEDAGGFSFALLERPDSMTDLEAHNVVIGMAGAVMEGPWQLKVRFRQLPSEGAAR